MKRHLHYRVFPVSRNGVWQWNLENLIASMPLFTGRRIVAVATEEHRARYKLDPPDAVKEYLKDHDCEFILSENQENLREVKTFIPALEMIHATYDPADVIFFGHTKGVGRDMITPHSPVRRWTVMMYELCLDYWPWVEGLLKHHPAVGPFKKTGRSFRASAALWHFSGSFYWLRAKDLFERNWRKIDLMMWGSESYPGVQFRAEEAETIAVGGTDPILNMYDPRTVNRIEREVEQWKALREKYKTVLGKSRRKISHSATGN